MFCKVFFGTVNGNKYHDSHELSVILQDSKPREYLIRVGQKVTEGY